MILTIIFSIPYFLKYPEANSVENLRSIISHPKIITLFLEWQATEKYDHKNVKFKFDDNYGDGLGGGKIK